MMSWLYVVFSYYLILFYHNNAAWGHNNKISDMVAKWAPLIWLHPKEKYFPSSIKSFLKNVQPVFKNRMDLSNDSLFLATPTDLDILIDGQSFLNGHNPTHQSVPTYVLIHSCNNSHNDTKTNRNGHFQVTYWIFFPYNVGKQICFIGKIPTLQIFGYCFGHLKTIGSHLGDWEHVTYLFKGKPYPSEIFLSVHDTGAYYHYDHLTKHFKFHSQKSHDRKLYMMVTFPKYLKMRNDHLVLFTAQGSHGLWPVSGNHEYVKLPNLIDKCGFGTPWKTWKNLKIFHFGVDELPSWMLYKGRWGNPPIKCSLWHRLNVCEKTAGPAGILREHKDFHC